MVRRKRPYTNFTELTSRLHYINYNFSKKKKFITIDGIDYKIKKSSGGVFRLAWAAIQTYMGISSVKDIGSVLKFGGQLVSHPLGIPFLKVPLPNGPIGIIIAIISAIATLLGAFFPIKGQIQESSATRKILKGAMQNLQASIDEVKQNTDGEYINKLGKGELFLQAKGKSVGIFIRNYTTNQYVKLPIGDTLGAAPSEQSQAQSA